MSRIGNRSGIALLLGSGLLYGTIPLFVTWLTLEGITPWFQLAARLAASSLVLLIFLTLVLRLPLSVRGARMRLLLAGNGLLTLTAFGSYITSISLGASAAKAVLMLQLYPLYVTLLSAIFLGEKIGRAQLLPMTIGMSGVAVMLRVWEIRMLEQLGIGDLMAILAGFSYAGLLVSGRWSGTQGRIHSLAWTFWSFVSAAVWLSVLGLAAILVAGPAALLAQTSGTITTRALASLLGLAVLGTAVPYALTYAGLQSTEARSASIVLLSEPVSVFVLAFLFLRQPIGWWQIVGGVLILGAGVLVTPWKRKRRASDEMGAQRAT